MTSSLASPPTWQKGEPVGSGIRRWPGAEGAGRRLAVSIVSPGLLAELIVVADAD